MSTKTVSYTLDTLPPLTEKQRQHLDALASRPGDQVDLADMPELTEAQLAELSPDQAADHRPRRF
jgi:hypothetical protein